MINKFKMTDVEDEIQNIKNFKTKKKGPPNEGKI